MAAAIIIYQGWLEKEREEHRRDSDKIGLPGLVK
jgi:hypothetical protein